jgi:hypothetical protein
MKRFELQNLAQARLITIRASSQLAHEPMHVHLLGLTFRFTTSTNYKIDTSIRLDT